VTCVCDVTFSNRNIWIEENSKTEQIQYNMVYHRSLNEPAVLYDSEINNCIAFDNQKKRIVHYYDYFGNYSTHGWIYIFFSFENKLVLSTTYLIGYNFIFYSLDKLRYFSKRHFIVFLFTGKYIYSTEIITENLQIVFKFSGYKLLFLIV